MQGKTTDPDTKAVTLAVAELFGTGAAAQGAGISQRTIQRWREEGRTDQEILALAEAVAEALKPELIVRASSLLAKIASLVESQVDQLASRGEPLTTTDLRNLTIAGGVWSDKLSGWAGWGEKDPKGRFGTRGPVQMVQVNTGAPRETPEQIMQHLEAVRKDQAEPIEGQSVQAVGTAAEQATSQG